MKSVYTAENGIASSFNVTVALAVVVVLTALIVIATLTKRERRGLKPSPLLLVLNVVLTLVAGSFAFVALSPFGQALLIYPYLLAGLLAVWLLAGLQIAVATRIHVIERNKL